MTWAIPTLVGGLLVSALLLRRWPLLALAVTVGVSAAIMGPNLRSVLVLQFVFPGVAGIEICYMAATRPRRVSVSGLVTAVIGLVLIPLLVAGSSAPGHLRNGNSNVLLAAAFVSIIAWLIGNSISQAQARAELVRAQGTLAERLRIARELHDSVAHSVGIIAIQAGAGRRVFDASPAQARDALAAIEATSRETLTGLRRMVTGLRSADGEHRPGRAPLGPAPGLDDLERLAAMTLDVGVKVDVDWRGSRVPLPADIELSAFRIVQEAVTNVVRHAGSGECQVTIGQQDGQLSIEVTDSGRGSSVDSNTGVGYGITGMRERAALLGGDLSAGPRPGGGFRVAATLPLPAPSR